MVARLDPCDRGADFFDHAGSLVAQNHGPHRHAPLAAHHVIVGPAQPDGGNAYQNLSGRRRIKRHALDRYRRADVTKQGSEDVHEL